MFTMTADLISVASLILMFIVLCCVVKIYSAVMADYDLPSPLPSSGNRGPRSGGGQEAGRAKRQTQYQSED